MFTLRGYYFLTTTSEEVVKINKRSKHLSSFFCHCPAWLHIMRTQFGQRTLTDKTCLSRGSLIIIHIFAAAMGRVVTVFNKLPLRSDIRIAEKIFREDIRRSDRNDSRIAEVNIQIDSKVGNYRQNIWLNH